ncbi:MAG TPA: hypothetical protein VGR98_21250, partial [Streptosporangiaceae bacterium]|nr:hypothetical protein [Streptosporangiaceae bacterium]
MVLAPARPRPPGPDLYPDPGLDPDDPVSGPAVAVPGTGPAVRDARPRLPGTTGEPDDIITWYVRPRRRRRRRRALAAAVLAAAT